MNLLPLGGNEGKEPLHTWISNPRSMDLFKKEILKKGSKFKILNFGSAIEPH